MNLNRALVVSLLILCLLVIVTAINFNRTKGNPNVYVFRDDEALMTNIRCIPEIIHSYQKVKNIYGKKNTLVFRYVQNFCSSCLDSQLNEILILQEEIGKEYIWIFPAYPDDRNSRIQLNAELAKYNYQNIPADSLLIPTHEGEPKSYFAWINNEGNINWVFAPDRNNVELTRKYFEEIKKKIQTIGTN